MRISSVKISVLGLMSIGIAAVPTAAFAGKSVSSPYVDKGEIEIESKFERKFDDRSAVDGEWEQSFEVGYGLTDYLGVEAGIEFENPANDDIETKKLELEAKVQLAEKGAWIVDPGLKFGYGYSTNGGTDEIEAEILLAKTIGKFSHVMNLELGHEVGEGSSDRYEHGISWKTKYKYKEIFSPGIEYYGSMGDSTEDYDDQSHLLGPVAYGDLTENFEYAFGVLAGISDAAPDATVKLNFEYKF